MSKQGIQRFSLVLACWIATLPIQWCDYARSQGPDSSYGTGLVFAPAEKFAGIPIARFLRAVRPPSVDLSADAPPIGDQGTQNSCVGWAVGYAARTIIANVVGPGHAPPFSPAFIYNRGRVLEATVANPANLTSDCKVGIQIETALGLLQGFGILPMEYFPYSQTNCLRMPTTEEDFIARRFAISGWARADSREDVLQSLANKVPVVVGLKLYSNFMDLKGDVYREIAGNYKTAHALVIVGYSDTLRAYKVMNSWGSDNWGDRGYGWIDYDTLDQLATVEGLYRAYILYPTKHD
jgi:hypothetical protein